MAVEENEVKQKNRSSNGAKGNSISEPNLATAEREYVKSGFPPGITVDELWLYRRKKPIDFHYPEDHLKPLEGSFKLLKSEYRRRFKNFFDFGGSCTELPQIENRSPIHANKRPESSMKLDGDQDYHSEYDESFIEHPIEMPKRHKPANLSQIIDFEQMEIGKISSDNESPISEVRAKYVTQPLTERPPIVRKPTNLKLEGEFYSKTENADNFIQYLFTKRPELIRKPTNLKLEGEMDIKTENRDKFVPLEYQSRPPLCKKVTNLHLEGDLIIVTEQQEQYVAYDVQRRPPLTKKSTNLHIEGELELIPEYRREFIEYKSTERPKLALPQNNLKTDGFYEKSDEAAKIFGKQPHPPIPFLRGAENVNDGFAMPSRPSSRRSERSPMDNKLDVLHKQRNAYIDYQKNDSSRKSRRAPQYNQSKSEGKIETGPEYKCSYLDFPRERPRLRRPTCSLSSEGDMEVMTEKREKYVPHRNVPRTESLKREPELKLEGQFECQPEYRKAYIDYLIRERVERKPRPLDNLGSQQKRVFDIVTSTDTSTDQGTTSQQKTSELCESFQKPAVLETCVPSVSSSPQSPQPKKKVSAASRIPKSPRRASEIENSLFGPKLAVPGRKPTSRSTSRSTSPQPPGSSRSRKSRSLPKSRAVTPTPDESDTQPIKKFGNPVKVENLAYRAMSPSRPIPLINVTNRSKWMRDSSDRESSSAFVVLDKEINNNEPPVISPRNRAASWYNLRH